MMAAHSAAAAPAAAARLPILEIFGPTIQGEGMVIGQKTMFVRTAGCDYSCSWCDSAFTWDGSAKEDIRLLTAEQIFEELYALGGEAFAHVTISGGNPALLPYMGELVRALHSREVRVAVETQGSRWQDWLLDIDELTLSPKPPSSGMKTDFAILDSIIARLSEGGRVFSLKVVIFDEGDLDYAVQLHARHPDVPFFVQSGNNNLTEAEPSVLRHQLIDRYEWLVSRVTESQQLNHVRVLPQLHAWLWGNKRGV
ncbi:7-carboxy-7-deazaguanine synthase QueE [Paenibacillus sp. GCM10023252]|uniref:7-carboxy-7-deazaguanine synthase QueE n=1 Tax=Paenibacillus sp. GCM10023252 TaxID=3252649 RepID=UPI003620A7C5